MTNIIENNKDTIYFIGDIHGEFGAIGYWIKNYDLHDCIIVFCGDFGLGFTSPADEMNKLAKSNKTCEERNIDCYAIRGNHDDPSYFTKDSQKLILSRFKPVPDYTVIKTPQHSVLCLGGAVSVDRSARKRVYEEQIELLMVKRHYTLEKARSKTKLYWWPDENFILDTEALDEIYNLGIRIDTVASHSSPNFCQPGTKGNLISWFKTDPELEHDTTKERKDLALAYDYLIDQGNTIGHWYYGHFHAHFSDCVNNTVFIGLNMGRASKIYGGVGGLFDMSELI